jgi:hypothetical protein
MWYDSDPFIMEKMHLFFSGGPSLATINKVRLHLQVVTLSNLVTADGNHCDDDIIHGFRGHLKPRHKSALGWVDTTCFKHHIYF